MFVNIDINVLDLIFQLLHETVHAIRDARSSRNDKYGGRGGFLSGDKVAMFTQFPDYYAKMIATANSGCPPSFVVNKLKEFSANSRHFQVYGLYYRLRQDGLFPEGLSIGGAAANLNKRFCTLRGILYRESDPRWFVKALFDLSPHFMDLVKTGLSSASIRKVGEWLGLDSSIDATTVIDEIAHYNKPS